MPLPLTIGTGRALLTADDPALPVLWLRRNTGLFTDTGATVPAVTSDPVAAWADGSRIFTQPTLASRPNLQASGALAFDGGDLLLDSSNAEILGLARNVGELTVYADILVTSFATIRTIFFIADGTASATPRLSLRTLVAGNIEIRGKRLDTDVIQPITSTNAIPLNTRLIVAAVVDWRNANARLYVNGSIVRDAAFQTPGLTSDTASFRVRVGANANNTPSEYWLGDIGEIRVYRAAHSSARVARESGAI